MSPEVPGDERYSEPRLRSLRPNYEKASHHFYVSILLGDIRSNQPSRNIAVSGAYGSGKSSVLEGLVAELDDTHKPITVALATLNQSKRNLVTDSGEKNLTSALEKEVVKRLIYSADPSKLPGSRFTRIASFRFWPATKIAALVSILVIGFTEVMGLSIPMSPFGWSGWREDLLDLLLIAVLVLALQYAFATVRISQLRLGPAEVSLDYRAGNYFDHYLDEIIYFFRRTKTDIVIFEDLDRFDDPGIFLALRELNSLLNDSGEISQHIAFVYAIRDSLFVEAMESESAAEPPAEVPAAQRSSDMESAASDRAKFFDLIVPIVPFISHEVSADLLLESLEDLPTAWRPGRDLVTLVGRHFTDMRVILSIRNEYEVFVNELLKDSAVTGLSKDQLFAMIAYKHNWLDDFEKIQTGRSNLDKALSDVESARLKMIEQVDIEIADTRNSIDTGRTVHIAAEKAGERLLAFLDLNSRLMSRKPVEAMSIGDVETFERSDVITPAFWNALASQETLTLAVKAPAAARYTADDVALILGDYSDFRDWTSGTAEESQRHLDRLGFARNWLISASISQLLTQPPPPSVAMNETVWRLMTQTCADTLGGRSGLAFSLLIEGYLDRNFALYTTRYYGKILSAKARSFMMQFVDRHESDPLFEITATDVDEILNRVGEGLLNDVSSLNIHIVDRLLEQKHRRIPLLLETSGSATDFLITYLLEGHFAQGLLQRVTAKRADILDTIANSPRLSEAQQRDYLSTCLASLAPEIEYRVSKGTEGILARHLHDMSVFSQKIEPEAADSIARLLEKCDLRLADLSRVAEPLRGALASAGRFIVTRANLEAVAGPSGEVGLDSLGKRHARLDVHLIANMSDYLFALSDPKAAIVDASENLDDVVRIILELDPSTLAKALAFLPEGVMYGDLSLAPVPAYPALAQAGAFACTRENVTQYLEIVGSVDEPLSHYMGQVGEVQVSVEDAEDHAEQAARQKLASAVAASEWMSNDSKLSLICSLQTSSFLDVPSLKLEDPQLAARLLAANEIEDSEETFGSLARGPWAVFEACATKSSRLAEFVARLPLDDELLANILSSSSIEAKVKKALLLELEALRPVLAGPGATAALRAAHDLGMGLTAAQMLQLAEAGAETGPLLEAIPLALGQLTPQDLASILAFCDAPFSGLATADGATFVVPGENNIRSVLQKLKEGGALRSFKKEPRQKAFKVKMAG